MASKTRLFEYLETIVLTLLRPNGGVVIKGWDKGVKGMKVGGHRKLSVPSKLGY